MKTLSTRRAAKALGIDNGTLSRYITSGKIPGPKAVSSGGMTIHLWTSEDIERVRKLLPKIANGRKTRYQKKKGKTQKPQPKATVPRKQPKKK